MPDNRFTDQEMAIARSADLPQIAEAFGYDVQQKGKWHFLKDARHIVIKDRSRYFDNYERKWGDAISFVQDFGKMTFPEAVEFLLNYHGHMRDAPSSQKLPSKPAREPVPFVLPEPNADNRRVFAYLRKRGIAYQVIKGIIDAGLLYEDKQYHNCVFVGRDAAGEAAFAYKRGTHDKDGPEFKGDVAGSNKDIGFHLPCFQDDTHVRVYESPIDLMSDMTMRRQIRGNAVALCGLYDGALETYLKANPHIRNITLLLDNDQWGRQAAERMREKYTGLGYAVRDFTPPKGKDWNEYLCLKKQKTMERGDAR